jgi:hypothetical protein
MFRRACSVCSPLPEVVLYNYAMTLTDSSASDQCPSQFYHPFAFDSVLIEGQMKRRIIFDPYEIELLQETWIEGIGSSFCLDLIHNNFCPQSYDYYLICVKRNDDVVYLNPAFSDCDLSMNINSTANQEILQIFSVTMSGEYITVVPTKGSAITFRLYDSLGNKIAAAESNGNDETKISTDSLKKGIYFYSGTGVKGEIQNGKLLIY